MIYFYILILSDCDTNWKSSHAQTDVGIPCVFMLPSPDFTVRQLVLAAAVQEHLCMPCNALWEVPMWQKNLHPKSTWPGRFVEVTLYISVFPFVPRSCFYCDGIWCHLLHGFDP